MVGANPNTPAFRLKAEATQSVASSAAGFPARATPVKRSLSQPFANRRPLLSREHLRDLLLNGNLPRQPRRLRLGQLLLQRRDLLSIRGIREQLGIQLAAEPRLRGRRVGRRRLRVANRLDRGPLLVGQVGT